MAAGLDLYSSMETCIQPGEVERIFTGISVEIPSGSYGRIAERSSFAIKNLSICGGVIDGDYRGEIIVLMRNCSKEPRIIYKHQKVAQLILTQIIFPKLEIVGELSTTERGENGFGSSGVY